jgi:hypothetical protein
VWIEDAEAPAVTEDSGLSDGSWTAYRAFQARGTDTGLGMRTLVLDSPAAPRWGGAYTFDAGCSGDRHSRCPQAGYVHSDTDGLPEGVVPVRFTATDAVGNVSSRTWSIRIDRSAPLIVSDQYSRRGRPPVLDAEATSYKTTIEAADAGAGVSTLDFELLDENGVVVEQSLDEDPQVCDEGCAKSRTFVFEPQYQSDGIYTLRTIATDQLGNVSDDERTLEIARGIAPITR